MPTPKSETPSVVNQALPKSAPYWLPKGHTLSSWATAAKVDAAYLYRLLTGRAQGSLSTWAELARTAELSINELLTAVRNWPSYTVRW